jgi:cytochrome c peroxidase
MSKLVSRLITISAVIALIVFYIYEHPVKPTPLSNFSAPFVFGRFDPPADNPLTNEAVSLGRHLFYDVRLSGNNKISCATCHK